MSSENPPINGALPVRAQRFLQTDNDLQQNSEAGGIRRCGSRNFASLEPHPFIQFCRRNDKSL